tara:strand:- start:482 stop:670 length:189 start_codon:yes stop_codon:yes gene_type:complete
VGYFNISKEHGLPLRCPIFGLKRTKRDIKIVYAITRKKKLMDVTNSLTLKKQHLTDQKGVIN